MHVCATGVTLHVCAPVVTVRTCAPSATMSRHEMALVLAARPSFVRVAQQAAAVMTTDSCASAVDADGHVDTCA